MTALPVSPATVPRTPPPSRRGRRRARVRSTASLPRTSPPSSPSSAACCCPRTPSPTSSRCSARPPTFYRPAHQSIYETILDLYGRGEPADAITVSAELQRRGELLRIGGAPYLHTLIATVPTAANAAYYAEIVAEKAMLRRLVEAGTRIVQLGYHGAEGGDVDEVVDRAQAAIYEVTDAAPARTTSRWRSCCSPPWTRSTRSPPAAGVAGRPDRLRRPGRGTNGLHPGS